MAAAAEMVGGLVAGARVSGVSRPVVARPRRAAVAGWVLRTSASEKSLAKELVRSRHAVNRLYENKAQLNSVSMHLGEIVATARTVGHLSKSAEVMKIVDSLMKAPELATTMQEFSKEMKKAGVMEEMMNDAV